MDQRTTKARIRLRNFWFRDPGWRGVFFTLAACALLFSGCLPQIRREAPAQRVEQPVPPVTPDQVDPIIKRLEGILKDKKTATRDRQVATELLNTLEMVKSHLAPPVNQAEVYRVTRLLFDSLKGMEKEYFLKERFDESVHPRVIETYASRKRQILQDYLSGHYEDVIHHCNGLQEAFGKSGLTPELELLLSLSLAKRGRTDEALKLGESVIVGLEAGPDALHLRAKMIEWYLSANQKRAALDSLEKMALQAAQRDSLLIEARARIGEDESTVASLESHSPEGSSLQTSESRAFQPLDQVLAEVDGLIRKNDLTRARFLLLQQKIRFPEGPETEAIDEAMRKVEEAEKGVADGMPAPGPKGDEPEAIKTARRLVEEEKYEEAISRIEEMQREGAMDAESRELKESAIEKLINRERNKAAKFFLMAKNTSDPAKKRELLSSSYDILKKLMDKYPSSPLNKKINDNMNRIREEMEMGKEPPG
ncbi:MAG: hypothetical protein JW821_03290 [Deltaproteobacteria bacterium]|nr:hypothetical protein [Deltaproteobacteria bacterium]